MWMRSAIFCLLLVMTAPLLAIAQSPVASNPMLHQQGTTIVDAQGHEVHLRGVNLGGWLVWEGWIFGKGILTSETTIVTRLEKAVGTDQTENFRSQVYENFITEADIQKIGQAGFNCVRLPLHRRLFDDNRGWKLLDRLLDSCERHKIYVVLDLHAVPGGQSNLGMADPGDARHGVWASEEDQKKTIAIWKSIAARYRSRKTIAGYDLINEPAPPSDEALISLYQRIIQTIRAEDPSHLIFLEGSRFSTDFSLFEKPLCQNQAFSPHMYTWFGDDRKKKLTEYQSLARKHNTPLWVGEFGENSYEMIRSTVEMYNRCPEINGWAFWTWKKAPNKFPGLVTINVPKDWEPVMASVGSLFGGNMPDQASVKAGMKEFIEAMKTGKCRYDDSMEKALLPKH
jgi:endoglucanase